MSWVGGRMSWVGVKCCRSGSGVEIECRRGGSGVIMLASPNYTRDNPLSFLAPALLNSKKRKKVK